MEEPRTEAGPETGELDEVGVPERIESEALAPSAAGGRPWWKFWARPRREHQVQALQAGYFELLELVRSIRQHLDGESNNRADFKDAISPLPVALRSMESLSESQKQIVTALNTLQGSVERSETRDREVLGSMRELNGTLGGIDRTNQRTAETMDRLGDRLGDSEARMLDLFAQARETEKDFSNQLVSLQKRTFFVTIFLGSLLAAAIGVLVVVLWTSQKGPLSAPAVLPVVEEPALEALEEKVEVAPVLPMAPEESPEGKEESAPPIPEEERETEEEGVPPAEEEAAGLGGGVAPSAG